MSSEATPVRHKRGDVREDGKLFWQYIKGREYWVTPEGFEKRKQQLRDIDAKRKGKKNEYVRQWRKANPDKARLTHKAWRHKNPEKIKALALKSREKHRERRAADTKAWRQNNPEKAAESQRRWRKENRDKFRKQRREYQKRKKAENTMFKLASSLRTRLNPAFKKRGFVRHDGLGKVLGCDLEHAKLHLESKFQSGMTWGNYGLWHIDHIVPLASAKNAEDLVTLCHYTNLQPLWAKDNIRKGAKKPDVNQDQNPA